MATRRQKKGTRSSTAAAAKNITDAADIPLAQPQKDTREHPTLLEIAAEQQAKLLGLPKGSRGTGSNIEVISTSPSGEILRSPASDSTTPKPNITQIPTNFSKTDDGDDSDSAIPPLPDTIFLSLPLSTIHFTLSFLAAHQYAQNIETKLLLKETAFVAFPVLTLLIHFSHGHIISFDKFSLKGVFGRKAREGKKKDKGNIQAGLDTPTTTLLNALFPLTWRNFIFSPLAIFLGMRLIAMANEASYYAVMKTTPAIGTLWAWAVLEISVGYAVFGLFVPVMWAVWWKGYALY